MTKLIPLFFLLILSFPLHAQECANNIAELKRLVGNNGLPLTWQENTRKNPLTLTVKDGNGLLALRLKSPKGEWANVTGTICEKGSNYVAKVSKIVWGPAAPGIAKNANIKELKLKLPYPNLLKVSVSIITFEFSPL